MWVTENRERILNTENVDWIGSVYSIEIRENVEKIGSIEHRESMKSVESMRGNERM